MSLVLTTVPNEDVARALARALLEARHIACATLLSNTRSLYRWKGTVADEPEVLVMMKTSSDHVAALKTAIVTLHPYETPEVLVFSASDSLHAYASWVFAETHPEGA